MKHVAQTGMNDLRGTFIASKAADTTIGYNLIMSLKDIMSWAVQKLLRLLFKFGKINPSQALEAHLMKTKKKINIKNWSSHDLKT